MYAISILHNLKISINLFKLLCFILITKNINILLKIKFKFVITQNEIGILRNNLLYFHLLTSKVIQIRKCVFELYERSSYVNITLSIIKRELA